ncbi:hypothetical protein SAZ11_48505 [Streptomyces sp. FXJ1.4098]|nr:hypothetical protein [Streptomyces sp. FXJ1.4098]
MFHRGCADCLVGAPDIYDGIVGVIGSLGRVLIRLSARVGADGMRSSGRPSGEDRLS